MKRYFVGGLLLLSFGSFAQKELPQYNPNSINPIARYEHLYKLRTWRRIDLTEKQNKGLFSRNGEITKLILDAARSGEIPDVYKSDSLKTKYPKDEFISQMTQQAGQAFPAWDPAATYYQGDVALFNGRNYESQIDNNTGLNPEQAAAGTAQEWVVTTKGKALDYQARDVTRLNLVEDIIFDKRRSRLYYDIQCIELQVLDPNTNTFKSLGFYKYKDLEKVFRNNPEKAVWFNYQNTAENKNFADAFLLRLFHGTIDKIENPDDATIAEIYRMNGRPYREAVWAMEQAEMMLMEKEHNLWEF
ncbi:MAG: gliding motility protein GldN [Flammeovirgaceae bacterium]|nr:gliding motility protein GldN [Flammeovirgaceae bacterium]